MHKQLMSQPSFKKIISNQHLIIQDLDKSYNSMCAFMELSNKYLPEAVSNFAVGQEHVMRIRGNLDAIHKIMVRVKKKMEREKMERDKERQQEKEREREREREKDKQKQKEKEKDRQNSEEQISNVTQAMRSVMEQEIHDNFMYTEPVSPLTNSHNHPISHHLPQQLSPTTPSSSQLQKDQLQKLLAYYKLDDSQPNDRQQNNNQPTIEQLSPTMRRFQQAFFVIKKKKTQKIGQEGKDEQGKDEAKNEAKNEGENERENIGQKVEGEKEGNKGISSDRVVYDEPLV